MEKKNWANVVGTVGLVIAIINIITAFLGLIPLMGLPLRVLSTFGGAIALALCILSCVFGKGKKTKAIVGIVLGGIGLAISLPLWLMYIPAAK